MTIRWTLYTLRTIGLLQWIDFLLIRYGPLHMILKLRDKPLQFQAAPNMDPMGSSRTISNARPTVARRSGAKLS